VSIGLQNNLVKNSIAECIRKKTGRSLSMYARKLRVSRKSIYDAVRGDGSRRVRVEIARTLGLSPSIIWPDNNERRRVCDDLDYMRPSQWTK
jgi:lambda repressor-like predicted transcriptional regulator